MPTFCRHNRFVANCPICREPEAPKASRTRAPAAPRSSRPRGGRGGELKISRPTQAADDGYRVELAPGLKAGEDARRLADEIARSVGRLAALAAAPPGLYAEVASEPDLEEATWLAFLIAYIGPSTGDQPFAAIESARTSWSSGEVPDLDAVAGGPRGAHEGRRGAQTITAYRAWAERAGSQGAAFTGDEAWSAQRRFERAFERLALPGLPRAARYDLLVTLGRLGRYDVRAEDLRLTGSSDATATGAKRVFGIGDPLLLERRADALAEACAVPIEALDLALENWQRGADDRAAQGAAPDAIDTGAGERSLAALGL